MLNPTEASAHVYILGVLALAKTDRLHWRMVQSLTERPLHSFAPRCNCGRVLMFGQWAMGSRVVACRCGFSCWESKL